MRLRESKRTPLEGGLNVSSVVTDDAGKSYLKRYPKGGEETLKLLKHQYNALGFTSRGGSFRRRSPQEQVNFLQRAASLGLKVLPPAYVDEKGYTYYRFFEGAQTLDDFLPHASSEEIGAIIYDLFADIRIAHANGIIYGDRWAQNILIVPRFSLPENESNEGGKIKEPTARIRKAILHIDFDIELSGPVTHEFELAEVTFYVLHAGGERIALMLANFLGIDTNVRGFNFKAFVDFLEKFSELFKNHPKYSGGEKEVTALIAALHTVRGNDK